MTHPLRLETGYLAWSCSKPQREFRSRNSWYLPGKKEGHLFMSTWVG